MKTNPVRLIPTTLNIVLFAAVLLMAKESAFAELAENWHWRNPLPQGHSLFGLAYGNSTFVAVGEFGTVLTSHDAISWAIGNSGTDQPLRGIAYGNDTFIAVGGDSFNPTILSSRDGISWTGRTPGDVLALNGVAFGNGMFVVVGDSGKLISSRDGITWTPSRNFYFNSFASVVYGNGVFVASGSSGTIVTSLDGSNWTKQTTSISDFLASVTQANATFIAVGDSGTVLTSPNGVAWTRRQSGTTESFRSVAYANGAFVSVGTAGAILTSPDGIAWTKRSSGAKFDLSSVASGSSSLVAVGSLGTILTSSDAVTWTNRDSGVRTSLKSLVYGKGTYVAVGVAGGILTSADGSNWKPQQSGSSGDLAGIGFGNSVFVAAGASGTIVTSSDGVTWTSRTSGTIMDLKSVAFGNGKFVIVGSFSPILTSTDGSTWTKQSTLGSYDFRGVAFGNGTFVAVGEKYAVTQAQQFNFIFGPIATSTDGVTWTDRTPVKTTLSGVAFGNGQFVAVGSTGAIWNSNEGINWTNRSAGTGGSGIAFGDGTFVTVGAAGAIYTSSDGAAWTGRISGTRRDLKGVAFANGKFVAAGDSGTILQSDPSNGTAPSFSVSPSAITNDYTGKIILNIGGLPPGQTLIIDTYLDENANQKIDSDEPVLESFLVSDGVAPGVNGIRNSNIPADEDGLTNGVARVELDFARRDEVEGIASAYVFKVSDPKQSFSPLTAPFVITPLALQQGVTGTVTSSTTKAAVSGALVVLFDVANSQLGASAFTDANGKFALNTPPGKYLLLGLRRGFVANIDLAAVVFGGDIAPLLIDVGTNQFVKRDFSLTQGDRAIAAKVVDQATGVGIPGLAVFASAASTNFSLMLSFGISDVLGNLELPATSGDWSATFQSKTLARIGYVNPGSLPDIDTSTSKVATVTFQLPKADALIYGTLKNELGQPLVGVTVTGDEFDKGYQTATTSDSQGRYVLGVTEGEWQVGFESSLSENLGYQDQSTNAVVAINKAVERNFVFARIPVNTIVTIAGFSPASGPVGTSVVITGKGFNGVSAVKFNETSSTFTVDSDSQITASVPLGAFTGPISITTFAGRAVSASAFSVTQVFVPGFGPALSNFEPATGAPGTTVMISGTNLLGTTDLRFGGISAGFIVNSSAQITAAVPAGALTGFIALTATGGTATTTNKFNVATSANLPPTIRLDTPAAGELFTAPANIFLSATANDADGAIKRVDYFSGDKLIYGLDTIARSTVQTSFTWNDVAPGIYTVVAATTDDQGARNFSKPMIIAVGPSAISLPALQITRSVNSLALTWPTNAVGYTLETTLSFSPPVTWAPVSVVTSVKGDQNLAVESIGSTSRFYRLRRTP